MSSSNLHSPLSSRFSRVQVELLVADVWPPFWRVLATMCNERFLRSLPTDRDRALVRGCHNRFGILWKRLKALGSTDQPSYRLSLDVFEAALCLTAVRAAARTKGCSTPDSSIPNTAPARFRRLQLVRRLENYERRLKRRFLQEVENKEAGTGLLEECARYRKLLVHELFRPLPALPKGIPDLKRQLFRKMVAIAQEGLSEEGSEVPPEKELRRLVSLWLRDVHRFRVAVGFPDLLRNPLVGKTSLIGSIRKRWAKISPVPIKKRDVTSIWSDNNEKLRKVMVEVD